MQKRFARYVFALRDAAEKTRVANDRPIYRMYLAEAAVLLASAVKGVSEAELLSLVSDHERTRGHTWLQDPEREEADAAWRAIVSKLPPRR